MENEKEPVVQAEENSVPPVNQEANEDYKRDMFKYKERMKAEADRAALLEKQLKEIEHVEEQKKGNFSKVIDDLKEKTRTLESKLKQKDFNYAKTNIQSAIEREAVKLGCRDAEVFNKLIGDKYDLVSLDDSFTPDPEDIKMIVEDGMKRYENIGLFGRNVNIRDAVPNNKVPVSSKKVDVNKMSWEEAIAYAKTLK